MCTHTRAFDKVLTEMKVDRFFRYLKYINFVKVYAISDVQCTCSLRIEEVSGWVRSRIHVPMCANSSLTMSVCVFDFSEFTICYVRPCLT